MYEDFCKDLRTGDLLLFNGSNWFSRLIEKFTHNDYSHVAIVLKNPSWLDPNLEDGYYMIESGIEDFGDAVDNKIKFGVQITSLKKLYDEYSSNNLGKIYTRKLRTDNIETLQQNIKEAYEKVKDKPYDTDFVDWVLALAELEKSEQELDNLEYRKTNTFWCSALVTFILVYCGYVDKHISWTLISPSDYCCYNKKTRIFFMNCEYENDKWLL